MPSAPFLTPGIAYRKSECHCSRRNSPSVADSSPTSSCSLTASVIAMSSAAVSSAPSMSPAAYAARASCSTVGRSRDPTWSARNGGVARRAKEVSLEQVVRQAEVHPRDLGGDDVVPGRDVPEVHGHVPVVTLQRGAAL